VDGLFEYWQPTHNSCITKFDLMPYKFGGLLARVSLGEVLPMIQAVITFRDRVAVHVGAKNSPRYVTLEQIERSEFFKFFGVREVSQEAADHGEAVIRYMTGGFQDQIFLSIRTDSLYRVQEAALTLRRKWVGVRNSPNPLANDITKSFLAAFTPVGSAEQVQPLARAIWDSRGGAAKVGTHRGASDCGSSRTDEAGALDAYYAEAQNCLMDLPTGQLALQNLTDSYSNLVLDIRIKTVNSNE
jgi:hypothetical protein